MGLNDKRNITIDILRVIGLMLVIAAHCEFPELFIEIREFDVVVLAAVSGMSFYLSFQRADISYGSYVKKRFRKLVLPVWIFLVFFFVFFRILGRSFSVREIIESFLLLSGGVLFIWVYRVFFINALLNPFLKKAADKYTVTVSASLLAAGILLNEILYRFVSLKLPSAAGRIFDYAIIYTLGYGLISYAGMLWEKAGKNGKFLLTGIAAALFAVSLLDGGLRGFYDAKYPPQMYYIAYGLLCTFVLYLIFAKLPVSEKAGRIITWLSVRTMRIYMWHVFLYYLLETLAPSSLNNAWLCYAVFFGGGVLGSYLQELIIRTIRRS